MASLKVFQDRWSMKETNIMLDVLESFVGAGKLKGNCRDADVFKSMVQVLQNSGVYKDATQLKNKVKYLKKAYRNAKELESSGFEHSFPFFEQLDRIYGPKDKNTLSLMISDVGTIFGLKQEEQEEPTMMTFDESSSADKAISDVPLLENIKVEDPGEETHEAESPQTQPLASTSTHDSKRPLEKGTLGSNGSMEIPKAQRTANVSQSQIETMLNFMMANEALRSGTLTPSFNKQDRRRKYEEMALLSVGIGFLPPPVARSSLFKALRELFFLSFQHLIH